MFYIDTRINFEILPIFSIYIIYQADINKREKRDANIIEGERKMRIFTRFIKSKVNLQKARLIFNIFN